LTGFSDPTPRDSADRQVSNLGGKVGKNSASNGPTRPFGLRRSISARNLKSLIRARNGTKDATGRYVQKLILMPSATKRASSDHRNCTHLVPRIWALLPLILSPAPLFATTLVVKLENDRIILASDTRQERFNPGSVAMIQSPGDDGRCKVRALGAIGFAVTGFVEYRSENPLQALPDWNANLDAAEAFGKAGNDIRAVAADWAQRAVSHFELIYGTRPAWLKQLASENPDNLLQVAFFAGWDKGSPVLLLEIVGFDAHASPVIRAREENRAISDAAFSTNAITQELVEGSSDRAQKVADEWDSLSESISTQDLGWKHVEFLIKKTAAYDPAVSPVVDVLSIPDGKPATWIQKRACD
jgi:hypothetical protein